jgi:hypothetical protein
MIDSGPCSAIEDRNLPAISSSASSQETRPNRPLPFGPVRRMG